MESKITYEPNYSNITISSNSIGSNTENKKLGRWHCKKGNANMPALYPTIHYYSRISDGLIVASIKEEFPYVARDQFRNTIVGEYSSLEEAQRVIEEQYERHHRYLNKTSFRPDTDDSPFVLKFAFFAGLAGMGGVVTYFALTLFR